MVVDDRYLNRELDERFKDFKETLERIEAQTIRTNGSVANLKLWRAYMTGGITVLTAIIVPLLLAFLKSFL